MKTRIVLESFDTLAFEVFPVEGRIARSPGKAQPAVSRHSVESDGDQGRYARVRYRGSAVPDSFDRWLSRQGFLEICDGVVVTPEVVLEMQMMN